MADHDQERLPMPGKMYLSSPGSRFEEIEKKKTEELNHKDLIMSMKVLDQIFTGMAGGKKMPDYLCYNQRGVNNGLKDVYLTYDGNEVFSAAAYSTASCLRSYGVNVRLEIGEDMYHAYSVMPLTPDAKPAYYRMIEYLKVWKF